MTLDASFNEVETLVVKAARGAGLSWGLAEDAGRAARWMAGFGLPWSSTLLTLLEQGSGSPIRTAETADAIELSAADGALSPLLCGPHLVDRAGDLSFGGVILKRVVSPLWLLPYAAQAASILARPVELACGGVRAAITRRTCEDRAGSAEALASATGDVRCGVARDWRNGGRSRPVVKRALVDEAHWQALEAFAARTYVLASTLSRAVGAGAGETDND